MNVHKGFACNVIGYLEGGSAEVIKNNASKLASVSGQVQQVSTPCRACPSTLISLLVSLEIHGDFKTQTDVLVSRLGPHNRTSDFSFIKQSSSTPFAVNKSVKQPAIGY